MRSNSMLVASPGATTFSNAGGSQHTHLDSVYPEFPLTPSSPPTAHEHKRQGEVSIAPSSQGFTAMLLAYRATGGTARGDDLARLLQDRPHGGYVSLARLIANRKVLSFDWRDTYWVPMFQFDLEDLSIRPGPQQVMAELNSEFDEWRMAMWFTQPNSWLNDEKPVDVLNADLGAVVAAARADRFIAAG